MKLLGRIGCAAAAALCLLVAGCGDEPLAKYVPEGANLVVGVDGVKLKAHPLTDKIIQMVSQDADGRKLEQEMAKVGLKPSDFEAEYLGFGEFSAEVQKGGVVIRTTDGRAGRIFEALKKEGAAAEFGGKPGLKMPGEPETHIVLVDSDLLMFNVDGDWEFPFKAEGKNKFALSQQFDKSLVLAAVDPSTVVATMPQVPPFAKKLQSVTFSVQEKGDKTLVTALACQFSDADAALEAKGMLDMFLGQAKLAAPPEAQAALKDLELVADKGTLKLESSLPPSEFDKFIKAVNEGVTSARARAQANLKVSNAKQILLGCMMYMNENDGKLPPTLAGLKDFTSEDLLSGNDFIYLGKNLRPIAFSTPSEIPLLLAQLEGGKLLVGYADGHVTTTMTVPAAGQLTAVKMVQLVRAAASDKQAAVWSTLLANAAELDKAAK